MEQGQLSGTVNSVEFEEVLINLIQIFIQFFFSTFESILTVVD